MSSDIEHQLARDEMEDMKHPDDEAMSRSRRWWTSVKAILERTMTIVVALITMLPVLVGLALAVMVSPIMLPLSLIIFFSLPKKTCLRVLELDCDKPAKEAELAGTIGGIYDRARRQCKWSDIVSIGLLARISLGCLVWLALSLFMPRLREMRLLGSPMWEWSLLAVTLTTGYFLTFTYYLISVLVCPRTGTVGYFMGALGDSIVKMVYFGLVLGTWLLYFRTQNGLNHSNLDKAFKYVTWTIVSLFVGSILMLFKNLLLVKWSADAIYRRFESRILITSIKYYFIGLLAAGFSEDRILDGMKVLEDDSTEEGESDATSYSRLMRAASVSKSIMSTKTSLAILDQLSDILIGLIKLGETMGTLLDGEGGGQEEVVTWFKQQINNDTSDTCTPDELLKLFRSSEESKPSELHKLLPLWKRAWIKFMVNVLLEDEPEVKAKNKFEKILKRNNKMANVLWRLVGEECSSPRSFTFNNLNIWMVDAHKDCINMGRTLTDAKAIVTRLDIFMSFVIWVIALLLWLLMTGISSTTVLVTVATPFLALTFIFGDSAKVFFQGLIFCFASHPFDVGDRCILDEVELEVKRIRILTTTFIKVGSKEIRLYPNSILATKAIVNLGMQPDPNDVIEIQLHPSTNLDALKIKIAEFFEEESKRYKNTYRLMISEVGENIKVKIQFSHILTIHDLSHSQCFKKKSSQRSDFMYAIKKYVHELQIEPMDVNETSRSAAS